MHDTVERLTLERHGAIRLGTPQELHTVRRLFALMGMHPVGYYDLAAAHLPMHATCFRPLTPASLAANPFRIFTTLLRPALVPSPSARALALALLSRRRLFPDPLLALLATAEARGGRLTRAEAPVFVAQTLRAFAWHPVAAASLPEYARLRAEHPVLADVACFRAAHINHLTPRALDIDAAQRRMVAEGMRVKARIEGPPRRRCAVLLRQTSFLALEEKVRFPSGSGDDGDGEEHQVLVDGQHKARFGEIEERGAALTLKGRRLYDELLLRASAESEEEDVFARAFAEVFPDSWNELRRQGLIYCEYRCEAGAREKLAAAGGVLNVDGEGDLAQGATLLERLVQRGVVSARPLTYEDFLPLSAAGIFQSNLQSDDDNNNNNKVPAPAPPVVLRAAGQPDREGFERALQCVALEADQLYAEAQRRSVERCVAELGLGLDVFDDLMS